MADTADLGSVALAYGFDSHHPHHPPAEGFLPIDIRTFSPQVPAQRSNAPLCIFERCFMQ